MPISNTNTQYQLRNSPPYRQFKYHNNNLMNHSFLILHKNFVALSHQLDVKEIKMILKSALSPLLNQNVTNYILLVQNVAVSWQRS